VSSAPPLGLVVDLDFVLGQHLAAAHRAARRAQPGRRDPWCSVAGPCAGAQGATTVAPAARLDALHARRKGPAQPLPVWSFPSVDWSFLFFIVMLLFIPLLVVLVVVDAVLAVRSSPV
jgi:hypothetical protein